VQAHADCAVDARRGRDDELRPAVRVRLLVEDEHAHAEHERVQARGEPLRVRRVPEEHDADVHDEERPHVRAARRAQDVVVEHDREHRGDAELEARREAQRAAERLAQREREREHRHERGPRDVHGLRRRALLLRRWRVRLLAQRKVARADVLRVDRDVEG